ncbi:PTS system, beta-glucoside-specific IIABC component [Lactobacillus equicursoris DSM 19284 = JCM 14600 = CIP 110162]|uniref:PTS system sucrose-specific EIIBCA component n=2 Tax=Lactobacillales TaxID=186826 RepID=K0NWB6_9LACO|nr:PTS beta-glucoside transporter subunit IIBCA [Lactobacillus equicursoris]KRK99585.1 beta-glucoside permease [Lactobacillus equicursoris DSM 19284 = JCM 14600 = CIP 110162]CCK85131.1 PTS system, beta-glucoside-specific IIABC component [Lactobacillus equicursoris DSM 19284 = JCM 14600 = CIP 110162]
MKYEKMNKEILDAIGGEDNIQSVVHCSTRLRFVLKDESKADDKKAESIDGVLQVVKKGGQYQLVIGNTVEDVYDDLMQMIHIDNNDNDDENKSNKKKNWFDVIIGAITGSIAPAIPLLAGAGMGKVLLLILTICNVLSEKSQTYQLLNLIFDTGYYFMPAYVGFSAAKIFKTNQMLGGFIGLMTVHPVWAQIVAAKKPFYFLGLPVPLVQYSATLITAILSVWIMSYIYKFVRKITPGMVKVFMEPMLTMLITGPLVFLFIGPLSNWISQGIGFIAMWLYHNAGLIAIPVLAALYPWLVSIGIHKALSPISIQLVATQGFDPIIRVVALCSNMSQAAASLAVGLKSKNKELKSLALSSSATAYLGGITEPALFGVNLRLKKPMYGAMIGGAIAGIVASFMKIKAFIYVTPAFLSLPMWVSKTENFVVQAIIIIIIASVATFIATWIIGFDDPVDKNEVKKAAKEEKKNFEKDHEKHELHAPVKGELEDISKVNDPTFASGVMGKGIAVIPSEGKIFAPDDGVVTATFETHHAIGLHLNNDADVLIHVGIDTVEMKGEGFKQLVKKGDKIKAGQELLDFNIDKIKQAGYDPTVIMIVTNSKDFLEVLPVLKDKEKTESVTKDTNVMILA